MRFSTIRIPCTDMGKSEVFYSTFLDRDKAFGSVDDGYIGFSLDNATLLIEPQEKEEFEGGRYLGFSLEVDDIQDVYERSLEKGISFAHPPRKQAWGGTMTHVTDVDGNQFSIVEMESS